MGLIILVVIGAMLGWLATIALRIENAGGIIANVIVGVVASLAAGIVAGSGLLFAAVTGMALLWAVGGALAALALFNLVRRSAYG